MTRPNSLITGTIAQLCFSGSWGGLEIAALDWTQRFQKFLGRSIGICKAKKPLAERLQTAGLRSYDLNCKNRYFDPATVREIKKIIARENVTFLFVHSSRDLWLASLATEVRRTRIFFFNRMLNSTIMKKDLFHRLSYNKVEQVIVLSELARAFFAQTTPVPPERIQVIPDAVDPDKYPIVPGARAQIRQHWGIPADAFLVLCVGRIDPGKGIRELVEAVVEAGQSIPSLYLLIVGARTVNEHEDYEAQLRQRITEAGAQQRVILAGHQENPGPFYQAADLFIMPSYAETFGLVLLEAMRFSLPVIATNAGAPPEILQNGQCGLLIEPRSGSAIGEAIQKLYQNPDQRQQLARLGYERVASTFFTEKVVARVLDCMEQALQRERPGALSFSSTLLGRAKS